jgi:hypothetical protein
VALAALILNCLTVRGADPSESPSSAFTPE